MTGYTRISDNLEDSSLWSDDSYEGVCALKLWFAVLREGRTQSGRVKRLTAAKAARVGAIPLDLAREAIERLTGPDAEDSSGIAEGRRLLPDPAGGPNDFVITNWAAYGREFKRANDAARQQRKRERDGERDASVTASRSERDGERDLERVEKKVKSTGNRGLPDEEVEAFGKDLAKLRSVSKTARRGQVQKLWKKAVATSGLSQVGESIARGVANYGRELKAAQARGFDRQPKEDATLFAEILGGDWQEEPVSARPAASAPLDPNVLELAAQRRQGTAR
ncbi:MAG: hypothetical protein ACSLFQ_01480 [Thermoanaerobaculia bacterium]